MEEKSKKLSTEPYKGVRDFYPEDMSVLNHIFSVWRTVVEKYGYEEYSASILEPAELYRSKTSEEIVNEQTYTFIDRGKREVTLRPEMTPTVARMVAGRRRDLILPIRWYSIPNCFRYERPQRGRLREFWQLNVDIFGVTALSADVEIISLAYDIMKAFGAKNEDFEIRINDRGLLVKELSSHLKDTSLVSDALRLIDKKSKMSQEEFANEWGKLSDTPFSVSTHDEQSELLNQLSLRGVTNCVHDSTLVRGFDYYTGTVFEVFDTDPKNPRSLFGGGRYDRLLENFGGETLPAVGFGAGDVILRDFLETRGLLPKTTTTAKVMLCPVSSEHVPVAESLAQELRDTHINVAVYYGDKKIGDQIKSADKKHIPFVVCVGEEEQKNSRFTLKELATGLEVTGTAIELSRKLAS